MFPNMNFCCIIHVNILINFRMQTPFCIILSNRRCARTPRRSGPAGPSRPRWRLSAAGRLGACSLEIARRAAAGPALERLMATEKKVAALQERLGAVRRNSHSERRRASLGELAERIDRLAGEEGSLRQAADRLTSTSSRGRIGWLESKRSGAGR